MKVKDLIEKLKKFDSEEQVYLGDNNLDEDTYYYQTQNIVVTDISDIINTKIVVITYRK
jgi:hypothetical protein